MEAKRITHARAIKLMQKSYDDLEAVSLQVIDDMIREKFIWTEEQISAFREEYLMRLGEEAEKYYAAQQRKLRRTK